MHIETYLATIFSVQISKLKFTLDTESDFKYAKFLDFIFGYQILDLDTFAMLLNKQNLILLPLSLKLDHVKINTC